MASTSTVPKVKISPVEAGGGFLVTCTACPKLRLIRLMRIDADLAATGHVRTHGRPDVTDEEGM
jgi:hypothetical protein